MPGSMGMWFAAFPTEETPGRAIPRRAICHRFILRRPSAAEECWSVNRTSTAARYFLTHTPGARRGGILETGYAPLG